MEGSKSIEAVNGQERTVYQEISNLDEIISRLQEAEHLSKEIYSKLSGKGEELEKDAPMPSQPSELPNLIHHKGTLMMKELDSIMSNLRRCSGMIK